MKDNRTPEQLWEDLQPLLAARKKLNRTRGRCGDLRGNLAWLRESARIEEEMKSIDERAEELQQ